MRLSPAPSNQDFEAYIELLLPESQQWVRAPSFPLPSESFFSRPKIEEELHLIQIENNVQFRILVLNKTFDERIRVSGTVEGKEIFNANGATSRSCTAEEPYIAHGFIRGNVRHDFKFSSTPLSTSAEATQSLVQLSKIGRIELVLEKVKRNRRIPAQSTTTTTTVSTSDISQMNEIWDESLQKQYGTCVGEGNVSNISHVSEFLYTTVATSRPKKLIMLCRTIQGALKEFNERELPLPEALKAAAAAANSSSASRKRSREELPNETETAASASSSNASPDKRMRLGKQPQRQQRRHPTSWTVQEVITWILGLGSKFAMYQEALEKNEIDGQALLSLDTELLDDIGVKAVGHKAVLLAKIHELKQAKPEEEAEDEHEVIVIE